MRVLVVEAIAPEGLAYLRDRGFTVDELRTPSLDEIHAALPAYEGLITRSGTAVTAVPERVISASYDGKAAYSSSSAGLRSSSTWNPRSRR